MLKLITSMCGVLRFIPRPVLLHLRLLHLTCPLVSLPACQPAASSRRLHLQLGAADYLQFIGILRSLFFVIFLALRCAAFQMAATSDFRHFSVYSVIFSCFYCCCALSWNVGIYALVSLWLIYRRFSPLLIGFMRSRLCNFANPSDDGSLLFCWRRNSFGLILICSQ